MTTTIESRIAKLFAMSDETWARHANPWSVWTRFSVLPLFIFAVWSRVWLGTWAWGWVGLVILWTWLNPRLFAKPRSAKNWASKAVLGERVWLNRKNVPVPMHHHRMPTLLSAVSGLGLVPLIWGLVRLHLWSTLLGTVLIYAGKLWFLDRMVWLYHDMQDANEEYASWCYDESET